MAALRFALLLCISATLVQAQSEIKPEALAHKTRGLSLDRKGEFEAALREYTEAIRTQPDYALAYFDRGVVYGELRQYELAIADYRKAISFEPNKFEYHFNLGIALEKLKRYDEAIVALRSAKKLAPDDPRPSLELGLCYCQSNKYAEAELELTQVIQQNPESLDPVPCLAKALAGQGKHKEAIEELRSYLEAMPDDPGAWVQLSGSFTGTGNYADAAHAMAMAAGILEERADPSAGVYYFRLAIAFEQSGNTIAARQSYLKSIDLLEAKPRYAEDLARTKMAYDTFLKNHGMQPSASPKKETVVPKKPAPHEQWLGFERRVQEALAKGDLQTALTNSESLVTLARTYAPDSDELPRSLAMKAGVYYRLKDTYNEQLFLKEAASESESRLGLRSPYTADFNERIGNFYTRVAGWKSAIPYFEKALTVRKNIGGNADVMTVQTAGFLADSLFYSAERERAIQLMKDALADIDSKFGNNSSFLAVPLQKLSIYYTQTGELDKAEGVTRRHLLVTETQFGKTHVLTKETMRRLAEILEKEGKIQDADALRGQLDSLNRQ